MVKTQIHQKIKSNKKTTYNNWFCSIGAEVLNLSLVILFGICTKQNFGIL